MCVRLNTIFRFTKIVKISNLQTKCFATHTEVEISLNIFFSLFLQPIQQFLLLLLKIFTGFHIFICFLVYNGIENELNR